MARKIIVVTAAYGHDCIKELGGQSAVLPFIAGSGADGVEIRRELFSADELNQLPALAATIERHNLLACYSAPEALFEANGALTRVCRRCCGSADPQRPVVKTVARPFYP
jgi:hypothetical protein